MALAASRARAIYGRKGYRPQSVLKRSLGDIKLSPSRQEGAGVAFNHFPQIADRLPHVLGAIVTETTEAVAAKANASAPVRTGNLKNSQSIRYTRSRSSGAVLSGRIDYKARDPYPGNPKHEYAFYVEVGTVNTRAQPFLLPALISERATFNSKCRNLEDRL